MGPEMGNHAFGMNTRIRSSGTMQDDVLRRHHRQPAFDFTLNGAVMFLPLPAAETCTVVADEQFDGAWRREGGQRHKGLEKA